MSYYDIRECLRPKSKMYRENYDKIFRGKNEEAEEENKETEPNEKARCEQIKPEADAKEKKIDTLSRVLEGR